MTILNRSSMHHEKQFFRDSLQKKSVIILSAVLFVTGVICNIICFKHNRISRWVTLDEIPGVLMISGLLLFVKSLKKPDKDTARDSENETIDAAKETIDGCKQILSEIDRQTYGDEDEGKEEISMTSKKLGKFIYRRKPKWYEAECSWCGTMIKVCIEVPDGDAPEEWLKRTESLFEMQSEIDSRMRVLAKQTLDAMKQTHRCPDCLSDSSSADFAERITPSSMDADADNGFVLYYDDDIDISDCLVIGHISENGVPERVAIDDGN